MSAFRLEDKFPEEELATTKPQELTVQPIAEMMHAVIAKGITSDNVAAIERLASLYERMQDRDAEKQFAEAFIALQQDLPTIVASTPVKNRGKYERFEDLMDVIQPILTKHGFTATFSQDNEGERVKQTCRLMHRGGHSEVNSFSVRTGRADDNTQADCKASTTAKRNALCNALNIVIRQDALQDEEGDARLEGEPVTQEQARTLRDLVDETNSDRTKFLKYAGAESFETIQASRYDRLLADLERKQSR